MKTLFGMTAAVLMVVMMLFVSLPETAGAAGKVSLTEMVSIKKAADEAAQAAKAQLEKARTAEEKLLAKWLLKQAETNAEVAGDLLEAVKAGEEVSREEAEACAAIAKAVNEAAGALAAGNMAKAEDVLNRIARMSSNLPTAANARAEMQGADGAVKNQTLSNKDVKEKGKNKPDHDVHDGNDTYDEKDLCPVCHSLHCRCEKCAKCGGKHPSDMECPVKCTVCGQYHNDQPCNICGSMACRLCEKCGTHHSLSGECPPIIHHFIWSPCPDGKSAIVIEGCPCEGKTGQPCPKLQKSLKGRSIVGKCPPIRCKVTIYNKVVSIMDQRGDCKKCYHCNKHGECVPDACKTSPSSPDDCPCVNQ